MKINASHSSELIQLMEVRQRGHVQVHIPDFNRMLIRDAAAIDFRASLETHKADLKSPVCHSEVSCCHCRRERGGHPRHPQFLV